MELVSTLVVSLVVLTQVVSGRDDVPYTEYQSCSAGCEIDYVACRQSWTWLVVRFAAVVFRQTYRACLAESCDGIVFRSAWRRESEKQPRCSPERMRVLLACY